METIRNYLENMFLNLPRTNEVLKAKTELGQMMEDKYNELIASGKTDNEAVGIVISEFGNLKELAEELGIYDYIKPKNIKPEKILSMQQAKEYIQSRISASIRIAIAVFLCIISPMFIVTADIVDSVMKTDTHIAEGVGILVFFLILILAISIFIFTGINEKKWDFVKYEPLQMDFATESYIREQMANFKSSYAIMIVIGVALCIGSVIPAAMLDSFSLNGTFFEDLSAVLLFFLAGIGVMLFIVAGMRQKAYELLLHLNGYQKSYYRGESRKVRKIMSVFWPTVLCIYLIFSFLTMHWEISWIIWPLAGVISRIIKISDEEE